MQIPVTVKRVVDINVKMRVKSEGSSVEIDTVKLQQWAKRRYRY